MVLCYKWISREKSSKIVEETNFGSLVFIGGELPTEAINLGDLTCGWQKDQEVRYQDMQNMLLLREATTQVFIIGITKWTSQEINAYREEKNLYFFFLVPY